MAAKLPENHQETLAKEGNSTCLDCQIFKVDEVVKQKMNRIRKHYIIKEQKYVNEMLAYEESLQSQRKSSQPTTHTSPHAFLNILSPHQDRRQMQANPCNTIDGDQHLMDEAAALPSGGYEAVALTSFGEEAAALPPAGEEAAALPPAGYATKAVNPAPSTANGQTNKQTCSRETLQSSMVLRNRYLTEELAKNATKLVALHDFVHDKEEELIASGYNRNKLLCMRQIFGVKKATVRFIHESAAIKLLQEDVSSFYD